MTFQNATCDTSKFDNKLAKCNDDTACIQKWEAKKTKKLLNCCKKDAKAVFKTEKAACNSLPRKEKKNCVNAAKAKRKAANEECKSGGNNTGDYECVNFSQTGPDNFNNLHLTAHNLVRNDHGVKEMRFDPDLAA